MAPLPSGSTSPLKRPLSVASDSNSHPAKRLHQSYHRHHSILHKAQQLPESEPALLEQETVDSLLLKSIKAVCEEEGLKQGIYNPIIESVAFEHLRDATEKFILIFCSRVRRSMVAARRNVPIACDFDSAVGALNVPRLDDQLFAYKTNPTTNPTMLPTPPRDDIFHTNVELPPTFLDPDLEKKAPFIPASLPSLPSKHTFKTTPVYTIREKDPRRIRELATEEGKWGEEALRKLTGAVKLSLGGGDDRAESASVFEETMRDLMKESGIPGEHFDIAPIVNCEKKLWLQDSKSSASDARLASS